MPPGGIDAVELVLESPDRGRGHDGVDGTPTLASFTVLLAPRLRPPSQLTLATESNEEKTGLWRPGSHSTSLSITST